MHTSEIITQPTSEAHPVDWTYPAGLNPGADTYEECRKLYSLSDLSQTQALRRNIRGFNHIWHFTGYSKVLNCLKRNFEVNQNLNYGTLLKIMVEIYYNVNRAQTVSYTTTVDDSWHKSFLMGNAAMCHGANKIQTT